MASGYSPPPEPAGPQPHPYLHEPLLYISGLPPYIKDEDLALAFQPCAPFRPNIARDDLTKPLSGTIEFKYLEKGNRQRNVVNVLRLILLKFRATRSFFCVK